MKDILVFSDAQKMASILDVKNAVLRSQCPLLLQIIQRKEEENGKENTTIKTEKKLEQNVEHVMPSIYLNIEKTLGLRVENTMEVSPIKKKIGRKKRIGVLLILKKQEFIDNSKQLFAMVKLPDQIYVKDAKKIADLMDIMRIIQNLMKLFGFVHLVISTIIINIECTVNDLTKKLRKEMRKSEHTTKACERDPKRFLRHVIINNMVKKVTVYLWQSGGKARFIYMPPGLSLALDKSLLIDLDTYNYAQAA